MTRPRGTRGRRRRGRSVGPGAAMVLNAAVVLVAACSPPQDKVVRVTAAAAPLFSEPEEDEPPGVVLHAGDLVTVTKVIRAEHRWRGELEGALATRVGALVGVVRAAEESEAYAFRGDLGAQVTAPTVAYLCRRMGGDPRCAGRLRRVAVGRGVVAYEPCFVGPCRVGLARGRSVVWVTVDGINDLQVATVGGVEVALAWRRWVEGPRHTGGGVVVLRIGDVIEQIAELTVDEVDGRGEASIQTLGRLEVTAGEVIVRGSRRTIDPSSGKVLHDQPSAQRYRPTPGSDTPQRAENPVVP